MDASLHKHRFLHNCSCFVALQETDNWKVTEMQVGNYIDYGCEHGDTAI